MNAPTEQRIALANVSLVAKMWRNREAPPLLALHGWLDNAASFDRLAPLLSAQYRVIALELPGHGHAGHYPVGASYHYLDYVRSVLDAADALGLERFSLLGHSLGAGIASLVAAARPERIQQLLLIEGLGPLGDDGSRTLTRFREAFMPTPPRRRALRVFARIEQAIQARVMASGMPAERVRGIVERGLIEVDGGWQWRSDPRLTQPSATRLAETQIRDMLRGIDAPTAVLLADPATPYCPASRCSNASSACLASPSNAWAAVTICTWSIPLPLPNGSRQTPWPEKETAHTGIRTRSGCRSPLAQVWPPRLRD